MGDDGGVEVGGGVIHVGDGLDKSGWMANDGVIGDIWVGCLSSQDFLEENT